MSICRSGGQTIKKTNHNRIGGYTNLQCIKKAEILKKNRAICLKLKNKTGVVQNYYMRFGTVKTKQKRQYKGHKFLLVWEGFCASFICYIM